jgi:hypothetical protein
MVKKIKKGKVDGQVENTNNQSAEENHVEVVPATIVESGQEQVFAAQSEEQTVSTETEGQGVAGEVTAANESDTQPAEKPGERKPRVNKRPYIEFVTEHFAAGDCTRAELVKLIMEKFQGLSKGGVETFLTDAKNPKYSHFKDRPVIQHPKTGKLIFADCVEAEEEKGTPEPSPEAIIEPTKEGLQPGK